MPPNLNGIERQKSIENVVFKKVEKNEKTEKEVMDLLHEYPAQFIHGVFEGYAENDFKNSSVFIAYDADIAIGCLMYISETKECNWLAVKKDTVFPRREIARQLFESVYETIPPGEEIYFYVNTEDSSMPGYDKLGESFETARKIYKSWGWEMKEENRINDYYGPGAHVYKVTWIPNPLKK